MRVSNILVIDDDEKVRDLLRQTLEKSGYPVLTASDGHEALKLIDSQVIDLVITDIVMPEQDGCEVLERLRRTRSKFQ